jgi:NAD(P)-dependent dehydrogenase (short-subunit alcohol dehydrogenase family)
MTSLHPALRPGRVAVVTGAANGIGFAAARRFASLGMRLCMADIDRDALAEAGRALEPLLGAGAADLRLVEADVAKRDDLLRLSDVAFGSFGDVALLMNNAAIGDGAGPWEHVDKWRRMLDVNLFGVIHGLDAFVPRMLAHGQPAAIVNVGSKQGITTPPGNAAYNVSKAGVKVLTEQLAHELRQTAAGRVTAHLLVPGFTFTAMTGGRALEHAEKPPAAWMPEQVIEVLVAGLGTGDFYLLCPDNEVTRALDERRIQWAADDVIRNRPALSRWHPDYAAAFRAFAATADAAATPPGSPHHTP